MIDYNNEINSNRDLHGLCSVPDSNPHLDHCLNFTQHFDPMYFKHLNNKKYLALCQVYCTITMSTQRNGGRMDAQ